MQQEIMDRLKKITKTLDELIADNSIIRNETLGIRVSGNSRAQRMGILENKTLRDIIEETQEQAKAINANILNDKKSQDYSNKVKRSWGQVVIVSMLLIGVSLVFGIPDHGPTNIVELTKIVKEHDKLFNSTNLEVANLLQRIEGFQQNALTCQRTLNSHASDISNLKSENVRMNSIMKFLRNPDVFLSILPEPVKGKSLKGSTFETIAAALPKKWSLAVEILNYLDSDLTGYQFYRHGGSVKAKAPDTVPAKTREVATFMPDDREFWYIPKGEMLYFIEGTNLALHLFFNCGKNYGTLAAALLPNTTTFPIVRSSNCRSYLNSGANGSHECITEVPFDTTKSLTVHGGNIFAKVNLMYSNSTSTITIQAFQLNI